MRRSEADIASKIFWQNLRQVKKDRGLEGEAIASVAGISTDRIARRDIGVISLDTVYRICKGLNLDPGAMLDL